MTHKEVLHEIVATEQKARAQYAQAVRQQEEFESYIHEKEEELRREYFGKAEAAIAKVEQEQTQTADSAIEGLDQRHDEDMAKAKGIFESSKDDLALKIFDIVVGNQYA